MVFAAVAGVLATGTRRVTAVMTAEPVYSVSQLRPKQKTLQRQQ